MVQDPTERPRRVLIVDDERGIRRIVQIALQTISGWTVFIADSGAEGLAMAEAQQPDVILLDVMMPGMDGIETFRHLQANPATQTIPVILLTAKGRASDQQHLSQLGAVGMIVKPFKAPDLVQQIRACLNW
jgi:two-component system, OmpR family, alkaline phosphatase synthesis response regulator PhoP